MFSRLATQTQGVHRYAFSSLGQRLAMSSSAVTAADATSEVALILGKPGGGKGTISGKILKDFPQFHHVSTGDLLRKHVENETPLGKEAKTYMNEGKLVPDDLMIGLLLDEGTPQLKDGKALLLDGFPRTVAQAEKLAEVVHVDLVINLAIPTDTIVERLADRWIHPASGRTYSYSYKAPKVHGLDDVTGEPLIQRPDDHPEKVRARLDQYAAVTKPLVEYYKQFGVLQTFEGTMSDMIYPDVKHCVEQFFN